MIHEQYIAVRVSHATGTVDLLDLCTAAEAILAATKVGNGAEHSKARDVNDVARRLRDGEEMATPAYEYQAMAVGMARELYGDKKVRVALSVRNLHGSTQKPGSTRGPMGVERIEDEHVQ